MKYKERQLGTTIVLVSSSVAEGKKSSCLPISGAMILFWSILESVVTALPNTQGSASGPLLPHLSHRPVTCYSYALRSYSRFYSRSQGSHFHPREAIIILFYRWSNWGLQWLSKLPLAKQEGGKGSPSIPSPSLVLQGPLQKGRWCRGEWGSFE